MSLDLALPTPGGLCRPPFKLREHPYRPVRFELTDKKLTECLIDRQPGLEVRVTLKDQLQRIQVSQKVEHGLLLNAARKIPRRALELFADFVPPTHR
jgi:hypothetical protein